uniref:Uncharacterized protein n=1 Tax=Prolemur simus TaxID=1328070 RepID=A0A8C9DFS2_PROSS
MDQPVQVYERIRLLRRQEDLRCLSLSECLLLSCLGLLVVALGIAVLLHDPSDTMSFSTGLTTIAIGIAFVTFTGAIAMRRVNQNAPIAIRRVNQNEPIIMRPRPGARRRTESDPGTIQPLLVKSPIASTWL